MKPIFKWDYCSQKGALTIEDGLVRYSCDNGIKIPAGKIYEFCNSYERKIKSDDLINFTSSLFGGLKF